MKLGYDLVEVKTTQISQLLKIYINDRMTILNLKQTSDDSYQFFIPIYQRYKTQKYKLTIIKSIGILSYLIRLFNKNNLIIIITFIITITAMNNMVIKINIDGTNQQLNKELATYLDKQRIHEFSKTLSYKEINDLYQKIKDKYLNKIDYLNVYINGSSLYLKYTNVITTKQTKLDYHNIIAKKDGVIKSIDVSNGKIMIQINDYVKTNDILISNTIEDTSGDTKIIPTKGKIYAYTYTNIQASLPINNNKLEDSFFYLLMKVRSQIPSNIEINREKVLSYGIIRKKIVLKIQYVFIENIAVKEK